MFKNHLEGWLSQYTGDIKSRWWKKLLGSLNTFRLLNDRQVYFPRDWWSDCVSNPTIQHLEKLQLDWQWIESLFHFHWDTGDWCDLKISTSTAETYSSILLHLNNLTTTFLDLINPKLSSLPRPGWFGTLLDHFHSHIHTHAPHWVNEDSIKRTP